MELDWYTDKLSANAVLTPSSSFKWSPFGEMDGQGSPTWFPFLNLIQDKKTLRGYYNWDEWSSTGSNVSSPKKLREPLCRRSLSGGDGKCLPGSPSSLSPKPHVCFGCVLHSLPE